MTLLLITSLSGSKGSDIIGKLTKLTAKDKYTGPELVVGVNDSYIRGFNPRENQERKPKVMESHGGMQSSKLFYKNQVKH